MKQLKRSPKIIGVSTRVVENNDYKEARDCLGHDWVKLLEASGYQFILIPNNLRDPLGYLSNFNFSGFILTGGDDVLTAKKSFLKRNKTEEKIMRYAIKNNLPLLGVCRGMQFINLYFKGKIADVADHVRVLHRIKIGDNTFVKALKTSSLDVNSYHEKGITDQTIGKNLKPWARAGETIEGLYHQKLKIAGIMWHPERNKKISKTDMRLFEHLFK
ncbi:MAG: gamma-glutamyl-gamma-aminobutyrate hydrolase family protein [bacterium]